MTLVEWLSGIGAVLAGIGGIFLVVRELNRRERRAADRQIDALSKQVHVLRTDSLAYREWAYGLAERMTDAGMEVPTAPLPHDLAEPVDPPRRWAFRRREEES